MRMRLRGLDAPYACRLSLRLGRHALPVVGAEGGDGEAVSTVEVADGVVGPRVSDGDGFGDVVGPDLDPVGGDDLRAGLVERLVRAGDREPARLGHVERLQA